MISTAVRALWDEPRAPDPPKPGWGDWVLVGAAMVAALLEGAFRTDVAWRPVATIVAVGLAPVLLWRRSYPVACVVVGFGAATAFGLVGLQSGAPSVGLDVMVYLLLLVYALVRWGSGRQIAVGLAVVVVAAAVAITTTDTGLVDLVGGLAVLVAAAAAGAALRYRADSERRARDQIRSQERVRLARELHDTVAHHISAISVQAQAGRTLAAVRPDAAVEALLVIEAEASRTLTEMRSMVRVLRDGAPAEYAPQRGVADLVALARSDVKPVVEVEVAGHLSGLRPQLDAAVYRMAQEAVTNALTHARHASRVTVRVVEGAGRLRLRVTDDGQIDPTRPVSRGFGLIGMAERAQLLGGTLHAGPAPGGGWAVDAELPAEVSR